MRRSVAASGPLVTPAWLLEHLDDPEVRVIDCRYDLLDPRAGRRLYEAEHVAGAGFLDLDKDLSGTYGEGRHPLPDPDDFAAAARRQGIRADTFVVAYDRGMQGSAARLWWLLRHFGHERAAVLEGGYAAWDGPVSAGVEDPEPGTFVARPRRDDTVDSEEVIAGLGASERVLVDARASERYRGESEPIDPVAGHIPGARNLPAKEALPVPAYLVDADGEIVAYCGSGVSACLVLLGLHAQGRHDAKLYPGSWSGYIAAGGPVAEGEEGSAPDEA